MTARALLRRLLISLAALVPVAPLAHAGLVVGEPRAVAPPMFVPGFRDGDLMLTGNGATFLATWPGHSEAVRLDRDGDALDLPPLSLGVAPRREPGRSGESAPDGSGWLLASRAYPNVIDSSVVVERIAADGACSLVGELVIPRSFGTFDLEGADGTYAALYEIIGAVTTGVTTFDASARKTGEVVLDGIAVALAYGDGHFAALLRDRVVLVGPDAAVERTMSLPSVVAPHAIAPFGHGFAVAAVRNTEIVVFRIDGDRAVEIASIAAGEVGDVALAASGDEILIVFAAKPPGESGPYPVFEAPIFAARISAGGAVERRALGETSRNVDVEGDDAGWLIGWKNAGPEKNGIAHTQRIEADEPLGSPSDDVDPVVWDYQPARGVSIATHGDIALVLWASDAIRGALVDARGARLSAVDLVIPELVTATIAARPQGFLVGGIRYHDTGPELVAYAIAPTGALDPDPLVLSGDASRGWNIVIECAGELCLAAWPELADQGSPGSIRVARIAGRTVLDPGGVPIAFPELIPHSVGLASDGTRFLVAWARYMTPGTIVSGAIVDGRDGLEVSAFDVLAAIEYRPSVLAAWNGAEYEIVNWGNGHRIARVRRDGSVIEGEESGWGGWQIELEGPPTSLFTACGRSYLSTSYALTEPLTRIYEIERRRSNLVATAPLMLRDVACFDARTCLGVADTFLTQPPSVAGVLAWVVPLTCSRERLVGR